ncbi:hypothetical protein [Streptomyces sp. NPDC050485]|uniref:hypothetical protein n=1 Tax=Streptomyces sp. NPDC050485 TaxID=3365617 RepID=UPI0037BD64C2
MTKYTPDLRLPYPEPADPPRGWEQMQAICDTLDSLKLTWVPLQILDGFIAHDGDIPGYALSGGMVFLTGKIARANGQPIEQSATVAVVPYYGRPDRFAVMSSGVQWGSAGPPTCRIDVQPDGQLIVSTLKATWVSLTGCCYPRRTKFD